MGVEDIRAYLMFRLRSAGYQGPAIFSKTAALLIARLSKGLIRRINILADKAMLAAYARSATSITWNHVLAAARDSSFGGGFMRSVIIKAGLALALVLLLLAGQTWMPSAAPQTAAAITAPILPANTPISTEQSAYRAKQTSLLQDRLSATPNWLASADPAHYSIQVLTANADANYVIEQFLSRQVMQALLGDVFVTPSVVKDVTKYNIVLGKFASFSAANQALSSLPDEVKRYQPYVRNVRDLQASAKMFQKG
jgi:septal ring-binding cell division protein DamX